MDENKYKINIELLLEKYKLEIAEEEDSSQDDGDFKMEEKADQNVVDVYCLSELSLVKMQQLRVSQINFFRDTIWDWRQEGSPLYKDNTFFSWEKDVSDGVSLLNEENVHLYLLLKMIGFYSLPQNACLQNIKSFNTSMFHLNNLLNLGKFLYKNRLFIDVQGNGTFNNTVYLRKEHFIDFLENNLKSHYSKYCFSRQVKNWRELSINKLIPVGFRLDFDPFDSDMYSKLTRNMEEDKGFYLPISPDTLSKFVPRCIHMIEEYSEEILKVYSVLYPIIAGGKVREEEAFEWGKAIDDLLNMKLKVFDLEKFRFKSYSDIKNSNATNKKLRNIVKNHPNWNRANPIYIQNISKIKHSEVLEIALKLNINMEDLDIIMYDLRKIINEAMNLITELRDSCVVILFLVTGMRNSEMYLLEAGNSWHVKGSEDDFKIKITVSKTSQGSSGDPIVLPIPEIAFKAFKCLEFLTERARAWGKSNKLMVSPTRCFGSENSRISINRFIGHWCENLGIEHIHPHQFRKTIAMFAIYQNPDNIGILRRLFSHKSLAMTLAYIVKIPGMAEEFKIAAIEQNKSLLSELFESINKKCIGGKAGNRINGLINESKIFKANLHDDGWENIEQYVEVLLQDGLNILHRTSLGAICTNTHSGLVHLGPETCNCNVVDCDWAVFIENSIEYLENDIMFHKDLLAKDLHSEEQKRFSTVYIKNCIERLSELRGRDVVMEQFPELIDMEVKLGK